MWLDADLGTRMNTDKHGTLMTHWNTDDTDATDEHR